MTLERSEALRSTDHRPALKWHQGPALRVVALVALVALACGGGWLLAEAFESPEQRAADASPPPAGPITVAVREGALTSSVNVRTTVELAQESSLKITRVVTASPLAPGGEIGSGAVVLELEGQPLFALAGAFPFYRDLTTNATGPDVVQLQAALVDAGFDAPSTGRYDWATIVAVAALYKRAGYSGYDGRTFAAGAAVVVGDLPARIEAVPRVGASVAGEDLVRISFGSPSAVGVLPSAMQGLISAGLEATLTLDNGQSLAATVVSVVPPGVEGDNASVTFGLTNSDGAPADRALIGTGGVASVTLTEIADDALLLPSTAVAHGEDGGAFVLKKEGDGTFLRVPVTELGELDGVTALSRGDGGLKVGDVVRAG